MGCVDSPWCMRVASGGACCSTYALGRCTLLDFRVRVPGLLPFRSHSEQPQLSTRTLPQEHWFTIRKVEGGAWYNFNSLSPAPEELSPFYLAAYLGSLQQQVGGRCVPAVEPKVGAGCEAGPVPPLPTKLACAACSS